LIAEIGNGSGRFDGRRRAARTAFQGEYPAQNRGACRASVPPGRLEPPSVLFLPPEIDSGTARRETEERENPKVGGDFFRKKHQMAVRITNMLSIGNTIGFSSSFLIFLLIYGSDDGPNMSSRHRSRQEGTTIRREK
jgi:hypothetical protein